MNNTLRQLQLTQVEILHVIDKICKEEQIKYSLYAGTLLGAVRHRGFIPWDDDLDICMERSEYNRFLTAWDRVAPKGYLLQNKDNAPSFTQSFTKIRKEHTTFLQFEWEAGKYHTGVFVDIFPIDRMPDGTVSRVLFIAEGLIYQLLNREFVPPKGTKVEKAVSKVILSLIPKNKRSHFRKLLLADMIKRGEHGSKTVSTSTFSAIRNPFPEELTGHFVHLPFEDGNYMCFKDWDKLLKCLFGEYMTLPPVEERTWKHHPIILDFERDYDEIMRGEKA